MKYHSQNQYTPAFADFSKQGGLLSAVPQDRKVIMASLKADVRSLAGAIAHTVRAGDPPTVMATGVDSINHAIKAIATARQYLDENKLDISCQSVFRNQDKGAVTFILTKSGLRVRKLDEKEDVESPLKVAANSDPASAAGAIAGKVRNGERVIIQSIGPSSVEATVRAVTLARRFLEKDSLDLAFRAEWVHVDVADGKRSAIKFSILSQQV
jgi:stage V sporulation protein S